MDLDYFAFTRDQRRLRRLLRLLKSSAWLGFMAPFLTAILVIWANIQLRNALSPMGAPSVRMETYILTSPGWLALIALLPFVYLLVLLLIARRTERRPRRSVVAIVLLAAYPIFGSWPASVSFVRLMPVAVYMIQDQPMAKLVLLGVTLILFTGYPLTLLILNVWAIITYCRTNFAAFKADTPPANGLPVARPLIVHVPPPTA